MPLSRHFKAKTYCKESHVLLFLDSETFVSPMVSLFGGFFTLNLVSIFYLLWLPELPKVAPLLSCKQCNPPTFQKRTQTLRRSAGDGCLVAAVSILTLPDFSVEIDLLGFPLYSAFQGNILTTSLFHVIYYTNFLLFVWFLLHIFLLVMRRIWGADYVIPQKKVQSQRKIHRGVD